MNQSDRPRSIHDFVKNTSGSQRNEPQPGSASKSMPPSTFLTSNTVPSQSVLNPKSQTAGRTLTSFSTSLGRETGKQQHQQATTTSYSSSQPAHAGNTAPSDDVAQTIRQVLRESMSEISDSIRTIAKSMEELRDTSRSQPKAQESQQRDNQALVAAIRREIVEELSHHYDASIEQIKRRLDALELAVEGIGKVKSDNNVENVDQVSEGSD